MLATQVVGVWTRACHYGPMTAYRRSGHYRRGPNGRQVWVSAHDVTRSSGRSYTSTPPRPLPVTTSTSHPRPVRVQIRPRIIYSIHWARPNATCPVCGQLVYFYSNKSGSRVYFDEIGPPWPKHPCTDMPTRTIASGRTKPALYSTAVGRRKLAKRSRSHFESVVTKKKPDPYDAFLVVNSSQDKRGTLIELWPLYEKTAPEGWRTPEFVSLEAGQLVFKCGGLVSYVDLARMEVTEIPVTFQYRSARMTMAQRLRIMSIR